MPEQSTGGPLTQRPASPRVERPASGAASPQPPAVPGGSVVPGGPASGGTGGSGQGGSVGTVVQPVTALADDPAERIASALESWRRALAGASGPDTLLTAGPQSAAGWLDLTHAHPSGLAQLFAGRPTRLSSLFREPDAHGAAWRQARSIRADALVLSAQRGVQGCCLAIGVATWRPADPSVPGPVRAPVVLRGCAIRPRGAGDDDFDLDLEDAVLINPELIRELSETHGIEADGTRLAALAQGAKGFDPRPVYAWLEEHCGELRGFTIERSLVLATFATGSGAVLADLDAAAGAIAGHRLLGRVAAAAGPEVLSLGLAEPGTGDLAATSVKLTEIVGPERIPSQPRSDATGQQASSGTASAPSGRVTPAGTPSDTGSGTGEAPGDGGTGQAGSGLGRAAAGLGAVLGYSGAAGGTPSPSSSGPSAPQAPTTPAAPAPEVGESRRLAVVGRLAPRGVRPIRPPAEPDPAEELLVLDCDPAQRQALDAVLRGENAVIEGPPGSGATHTLAAAIAGLVAAGRRVLILSPRRASTEALLSKLDEAGIGDLVLDLRDGIAGRPAERGASTVAALRASLEAATSGKLGQLPRPGTANGDEKLVRTIRRAREMLDGEVEALHEVRKPWGVSVYDAMVALSELTGRRDAPASAVRLEDDVLSQLDVATRERLRVHLHSAAAAGVFTLTRADTRWYDARVSTEAEARAALEAAVVLRTGLDRARTAMTAAATAAGLHAATEVRSWLPQLELLLGVRAVVDAMSPTLYQQPLEELAEAVAPRHLRVDSTLGRRDRRRLRRQASALVRPGVYVPDLHQVLLTASRQRTIWRRLSAGGEGPRVVVGLSEAEAAVNRVLSALQVLSGVLAETSGPDLADMPLTELQRRVLDLAQDGDSILGQPRRSALRDGLIRAGLGAFAEDLQARRVPASSIDAEWDLVWWSSVRDGVVRGDPRLADHDQKRVQLASEHLRRAESARIAAGSGLVRTAVMSRAAKVAAVRAGQVRVLREELSRADGRPRLVDLLRRCGDVLGALAPVWMMSPDTVAGSLPSPRPGAGPVVDAVVVDDAGHIGLPEVVAALARGGQIIVAGDRRRLAPPDSSSSVIEALAPFAHVCRLDRDHRTTDGRVLVPLAPRYPEGWRLTPGTSALPPLHLEAVPDGIAIPPPGEQLPVSSDAEVNRVVSLVEQHAADRPTSSLVVVTLSERHAERIEEALRLQVAERPVLAAWLADQRSPGRPEPFVIRSVRRVLGVERDCAIVSIGLARTPHGRVLHRFGVLDGDKGAAALTTAVSRARSRTTIVCCFTADDLIVDRLRTAGARLLRDVLLAAGGRGTAGAGRTSAATDGLVADLRDRLTAAGLPVQTRVGDGAWPLDIAVADPRVPGRMLLAVDVDSPAFAAQACRERERSRPARWERTGWTYLKVSALDLFDNPSEQVARITDAFHHALSLPLPPEPAPPPPAATPAPAEPAAIPAAPQPGTMPGPAQPSVAPASIPAGSPVSQAPIPDSVQSAQGVAGQPIHPAPAGYPPPADVSHLDAPTAAPSDGPTDAPTPWPSSPAPSWQSPVLPVDEDPSQQTQPMAPVPPLPTPATHVVLPDAGLGLSISAVETPVPEAEPPVGSAPMSSGPEDDDAPVLPDRARDDSDEGWGESSGESSRDDELRRERPPHWD